MDLIGRKEERKILHHCLQSTESKLVAVFGRRRVGKTFLIRNHFKDHLRFEISGLHGGDMEDQLSHFVDTLNKHGLYVSNIAKPTSWRSAFSMLSLLIDGMRDKKKKIIFIDELPWLDTPKSKFLMAFENFWNSYCSHRKDIVMVICGSAASWMIKKILGNKGGLHNRVSEKIKLSPFNLAETEQFLLQKGVKWNKYDIAQLYMITGGIPFYLDAIRKGESIMQFVDRACFQKSGILYREFDELYSSLFDDSVWHYKIVQSLAKVKKGMDRNQIIKSLGLQSGGTFSTLLEELQESGFITNTLPYGASSNQTLFKLTDSFTLFYFKFMQRNTLKGKGIWLAKSQSQSWISWSGLAFENLCMQHMDQIKSALNLQVIYTETSTWSGEVEGEGAQIDLIIDRADRIVHVCEIKFSKSEFVIDKSYAAQLRRKLDLFSQLKLNKKKVLFLTMITPYGVKDNEYSKELIQNEIVIEDLF